MAGTGLTSQQIVHRTLANILLDFDISAPSAGKGPRIVLTGAIPPPTKTRPENINLSLIGTIPSLANAVTAAQIFEARGGASQDVEVDLRRGHNYIDPDIGMTPAINGQEIPIDVVIGNPFLANIFDTKDGRYVVLSAVYVDLIYQWSAFLGCSISVEAAAAEAGLPMAICQTETSWEQHPQGAHLKGLPWVPVQRVSRHNNHAPGPSFLSPILPRKLRRPLSGLRVLCVTHAIAGPSSGRTLAEHGASVLQVMFNHGFEHHFVYTYANLGTASTRLNLHKASDRARLQTLVRDAHVWIDSYRDQAISKFGFSEDDIRTLNPALIVCRTRCYGTTGPWSTKPGFDMQGSASIGLMSYVGEDEGRPQWPPGMVINDYTTGYSAALAIQSIILKWVRGEVNVNDGWNISPSLCGTAMGMLKYYKTSRFGPPVDSGATSQALPPETLEGETSLGYLKTLAPLPKMSLTPIHYADGLLCVMGSSRPVFSGFDDGYDVKKLVPMLKEDVMHSIGEAGVKKLETLRVLGERIRAKRYAVGERFRSSLDVARL